GGNWYTGTWYWPQILYPYHKSTQVFACPSGYSDRVDQPRIGHYGANSNLMFDKGTTPPKLTILAAPATTYMAMDMGQYKIYIGSSTNDVVKPVGASRYLPGIGAVLGKTGANGSTSSNAISAALHGDFEN